MQKIWPAIATDWPDFLKQRSVSVCLLPIFAVKLYFLFQRLVVGNQGHTTYTVAHPFRMAGGAKIFGGWSFFRPKFLGNHSVTKQRGNFLSETRYFPGILPWPVRLWSWRARSRWKLLKLVMCQPKMEPFAAFWCWNLEPSKLELLEIKWIVNEIMKPEKISTCSWALWFWQCILFLSVCKINSK